jgi:DNA-binding transcriptional MerR regulator
MNTIKTTLRSGELAKQAGVSTDTLRYYERKGLLAPARADNGYRQYPASALERVLLVRRALAIGFRLDDLARILQQRDRGGVPCREVRALAADRLDAVEIQIAELTRLRDDLQIMLEEWDARLANTPEGEPARLLENLPTREQITTPKKRTQK